jgi:four helix bundle protein
MRNLNSEMGKEKIESFKDLMIWKSGIELSNEIYRLTSGFPKEEVYGLSSQMRRAVISVPSNIAEGWGRGTTKSYILFLEIARGSLYELDTLIEISFDLNFISTDKKTELINKIAETGKMLNALISKLKIKNQPNL